jgi:hypothetical protein
VILSEAKNLSFFFMGSNPREILRFAQNDKNGGESSLVERVLWWGEFILGKVFLGPNQGKPTV